MQMAATLPALVVNGLIQADCPATPSEMLLQWDHGPYTTVRVAPGFRFEAWAEHVARLAEAVVILNRQHRSMFMGLLHSLQVEMELIFAVPAVCVLTQEGGGSFCFVDLLQDYKDVQNSLRKLLDHRLRSGLAPLATAASTDAPMHMAVTILICSAAAASDINR